MVSEDGASTPRDVLPGTLDLLVLRVLELAPMHGWGIGQRIEQVSGIFRIKLGSLYPALQRLEDAGLLDAEWSQSENGRRARYYRITRAGRKRLAVERREWERLSAAMARLLEAT
jgi:PadR family transcriptional regulator PadR